MRVWVAYINYGYEGKSEPKRVFATKQLADAWADGASDSFGTTAEVVMLEVIGDMNNDQP